MRNEADQTDENGPAMEVEVLDTNLELEEELTKEEVAVRKRLQFVEMFNEIASIAVPSSLWGIHRDDDNCQFIVFSKYDDGQMQCTKVLRITDEHVLDIRADGLFKTTTPLNELDIDIIVDALRGLDEA